MEIQEKSSWGGKRQNAGRKKSAISKKTVVVRVDEKLLPIIKTVKDKYQAGQPVESLLSVTGNQDELLSKIEQIKKLESYVEYQNNSIYKLNDKPLKKENNTLQEQIEKQSNRNLELVLQRDSEHLQAVKLKGKVLSLKSTIKSQKAEIEAIKHKIYDCQVLKKDG